MGRGSVVGWPLRHANAGTSVMTTLRSWSALLGLFTLTGLGAQTLQWAQASGAVSQEVWEDAVIDDAGSLITVGTLLTAGTPVDLDPGPGVFHVGSLASSYDIFFRKVDANGNFQWGGAFGGNTTDAGLSVAVDGSDNVYLSGTIGGTADLDPGPGVFTMTASNAGFDAFVVKLSPTGVFQWGRMFGGLSSDAATAIAVDTEGNVWTTGYLGNGGDLDPGAGTFNVTSNGMQDIFISKLDPSGLFSWGGSIGGTGNDLGLGIAAAGSGHVVVCGEFRNTADFDPGAGTLSHTSAGGPDMFVMRLNGIGAVQWAHRFGGTSFENARSVAVDAADNVGFTGEVNSTTDMDPGPGVANLAGSGFEPSFVAKITGEGAYQWAYLFAGFINKGNSVAFDAQGGLYATGVFGGTMDMDPGPGVTNLTAASGLDGYVVKYTDVGTLGWCFKLDASTASMAPECITVAGDAVVVVTGAFPGSMDMDPSAGSSILTSAGATDAFTGTYTQTTPCANLAVQVKMVLEGPWKPADQLMVDSLRVRGMLPLVEPYTALGLAPAAPASITAPVLTVAGPDGIVDWVLLELRAQMDPSQIVERRAALLQRDGDVVATDGVSGVLFCAPPAEYHLAARHRNHLGVMTSGHLSLSGSPTTIDLMLGSTPVFGTDPRHDLNGVWALWPGNVVPNAEVAYTGSANDRDPILVAVGSSTPTNAVSGYADTDVNLDGTTKYTGSGNDRDPILVNVGGTTPNNTRAQQLP